MNNSFVLRIKMKVIHTFINLVNYKQNLSEIQSFLELNTVFLPSAWPAAASPFWFMLFFLQCFFLSVRGEAEPTSLVEEELETPSSAESDHRRHVSQDCLIVVKKNKVIYWGISVCLVLTNSLSVVRCRGGAPLNSSVTPQEERSSQPFHLLHLQEAAGTYRH